MDVEDKVSLQGSLIKIHSVDDDVRLISAQRMEERHWNDLKKSEE